MPKIRLALGQINPTLGDIAGNSALIMESAKTAAGQGAQLFAVPEMALTGYPLEDLAHRETLISASKSAVLDLARQLESEGLGDLVVVVGHLDHAVEVNQKPGVPRNSPTNTASVLHRGKIVARYDKHHLPNYGVFDEFRQFVPGTGSTIIRVGNVDIALAICEDIWQDGPTKVAAEAGVGLLLVLNGSPYETAKDDVRLELCSRRAQESKCALAYVNLVGGQDELVFDGDSLIVDSHGELIARAPQFESALLVADLDLPESKKDSGQVVISNEPFPELPAIPGLNSVHGDALEQKYAAIVLGLRDYVTKNNFPSVLLGLSGGIDSALVAAIAVDAMGADRVYAVSNPSQYSSEHSKSDAKELAERTGIHFETVEIAPMFASFQDKLHLTELAEENLQARIRAVIWMGISNQHNHLVLACGNKSELAVGYSTMYGDAVGGFAPIKDVPKTIVWQLAKWRNQKALENGETPPIPESIITKPPSAELRPGQLDTDSLPPYEILDAILEAYVENELSTEQIIGAGFDEKTVTKVINLVDRAEFKRRQYPIGPKISKRNFGRDRRLPITSAWREPS